MQHQSANSALYVAGIALTASWLATTVYLMRQNFSLRQCQQHALDDRGQHVLDDDDDNRCSNNNRETDTLSSKSDSQFIMHEIGVIQSPFPQRAGCPRQGTLAPHVKSLLWLHPHLSPQVLDGILEYSHVWIIFQFHLNPRNKARKSNGCSNTVYYVYRQQGSTTTSQRQKGGSLGDTSTSSAQSSGTLPCLVGTCDCSK